MVVVVVSISVLFKFVSLGMPREKRKEESVIISTGLLCFLHCRGGGCGGALSFVKFTIIKVLQGI